VLGARIGLMEGDYPTPASRALFYEKLVRELRATPEFESAALSTRFQMMFSAQVPVEIEGKSYAQPSDRTIAQAENVSPDFARTLGQKVVEGRYLADEDSDAREPIAVVNASFARKHFGSESAIGRRFRTNSPDGKNPGPWRRITGIVTDVRMLAPFNTQNDNAGFYVPLTAAIFGALPKEVTAPQFATIVAKPRGGQRGESLTRAVAAVVQKIDPNLPPYFVQTPKASLDAILAQNRIVAGLFGVFGLMAVVLASVGLYGVQSFSVNQRTQEFGVRMALGAQPSSILGMVFRSGAWQLGVGLVLGLGLMWTVATLFSQEIAGALFITQIAPSDLPTYVAVAGLLTLVSAGSVFVPARRATRVDPMIALRAE